MKMKGEARRTSLFEWQAMAGGIMIERKVEMKARGALNLVMD